MPESRPNRITDAEIADPRWKDLCRIDISTLIFAVLMLRSCLFGRITRTSDSPM